MDTYFPRDFNQKELFIIELVTKTLINENYVTIQDLVHHR